MEKLRTALTSGSVTPGGVSWGASWGFRDVIEVLSLRRSCSHAPKLCYSAIPLVEGLDWRAGSLALGDRNLGHDEIG